MFDVFYFGPKPNLFVFEKPAVSLEDAARQSRTGFYWYIYGGNDYTGFDFDYTPVPWETEFTHVWPSQHQANGEVYLTKDPAAQLHYHDDIGVHRLPIKEYWYIPDHIDPKSIDWRWSPNPADPPYVYHFPVKWNWDRVGGPEYRVPGAQGDKYVSNFIASTRADMEHWIIPNNIDRESFDFSWRPHPKDPPFNYKFPTVWNNEGGPEYCVPGATQEKYISELVAETLPDMTCWNVPEEVNIEAVDFSWAPHPKDPPYIYHFGTDYQQSVGLTYTVPGATEIKFAGPIPSKVRTTALEVLDIFFIDCGNGTATTRYERLKARHPQIQKVRFANSIMDTIRRCVTRSNTNKFWIISSEYNYDEFDFAWHSAPWQSFMTHVFPSQHQKWSNTFLISKHEFNRHSSWATSLEEFPNLNFVTDQTVTKQDNLYDIYYVDHGNTTSRHQYEYLRVTHPDIVNTRFVDNYLDTFKRIMATAGTDYVWIINSVCDYSQFDFTWQPEPWQKEMIHVFPSNGQKRGDTFYIHVESFKKQMIELDLLDWFNVINYCEDQQVPRFSTPTHHYEGDDLVTEIKNYKFDFPYAIFSNQEDLVCETRPCLWSQKDRVVGTFTRSGAVCEVPRDVKTYLKTQLYDYPYLERNDSFVGDQPLDIIYISNGEPDAEKWYERLRYQLFYSNSRTPDSVSRLKRVQNVNGRAAAYKAAAELSDTPWFFAVFAKLEVEAKFDWEWQPDYWQEPKHYIFYARNPVNGLEYGHQAMIAYNKKLVLETEETGLDFTLASAHEVVPIVSGTAHFNQNPWMTWRTAFREVLKLRQFMDTDPTLETEYRLNTWLTKAAGAHANWSTRGAKDAVAYYESVSGDQEELMKSFEWDFLQKYFNKKYK